MTSASKLFNSKRIRFGARNNSVASDSSVPARTTTDRRNHNRIHTDGISEHDLVLLEQGRIQPPSGSIINSEDFRSIRRWGATENDRLPGVVLLARERLLERLRGVHVTENSTRSSSSIHQHDYSFLETNSNLFWPAVMPLSSITRMLPCGLSEHELNLFSVTVFKTDNEESNESCTASKECSICLGGFEDGEQLIKLSCMHRFHSLCLLPWVEVCGACPNCRKDIVVANSN